MFNACKAVWRKVTVPFRSTQTTYRFFILPMTFANNQFADFLIKNGFTLRKSNNAGEPVNQYKLFQKDDIYVDFFAGIGTIYRKKKTLWHFELCTDNDRCSPRFEYKKIPPKIIKFLSSLPNIILPEGVTLLMTKDVSRKISKDLRNRVMDKCNRKCVNCASTHRLAIDHIFPISKGGPTIFENLQVLCIICNLKKSNKLVSIKK